MIQDFQQLAKALEDWGADPREALADSFTDDTDFYLSCLVKFAGETFLQTLHATMSPEKKNEAIRAVHTMKGNADYLGLFPVMDAAMAVLTELRADRIDRAAACLPELEKKFAEFKNILS